MKSIGAQIQQLTAMLGTDDLSAWETSFVESVAHKSLDGTNTAALSEAQITKVEQIFKKHFGDAE